MKLTTAIERLDRAAQQGTGASAGAATVLLFGWNSVHPMRGLMSLDGKNRAAALTVIANVLDYESSCERLIESIVGYAQMQALKDKYGVSGRVWRS